MAECLFCRIASGALPAARVYEDDAVLAIRDINPQAPVHVLLLPRRHLTSVVDAAADPALLGRLAAAAVEVARREGIAERGFRLLTNAGPDAGQTVAHLHFHLLGGRAMGWPPG
jgi:histidine triad (HIT) family protein